MTRESINLPDGLLLLPDHDEHSAMWAGSMIWHSARLCHLRRMVLLARQGLVSVDWDGSEVVTVSVNAHDVEAAEVDNMRWFSRTTERSDRTVRRLLDRKRTEILRKMKIEGGDWHESRFCPDQDDCIEKYFRDRAVLRLRTSYDNNALDGDSTVGPLMVSEWRGMIVYETAQRLRHMERIRRFARKRGATAAKGMTTRVVRRSDAAAFWANECNIDPDAAELAIRCLTLHRDNVERYSEELEVPNPLYVDCGQGLLASCVFGALRNPLYFAWREMKACFPSDWQKAISKREERWRSELKDVFASPRFTVIERPRLIRKKGIALTDIDAVIVDHQSHVLGLVQLKWQDPFGTSVRERRNRLSNFLDRGNDWVQRVSEWVAGRGSRELAKVLSLRDWENVGAAPPRLFVVARNQANFTTRQIYDPRAAWCSWLEIIRLASESKLFSIDEMYERFHGRERYFSMEKPLVQQVELPFPS